MAARVVHLSKIRENEDHGKKVNDLVNLINHGFDVVEAFVITANAFQDFLTENNLDNKIKHLSLTGAEKHVNKHLLDSIIPQDLVNEILKAYKNLGAILDDPEVTVNGQKIKGDSSLIEKIKEVWLSGLRDGKIPTIIVKRVHFGKHGKIRTSSKFIHSVLTFSPEEIIKIEGLLDRFKKIFYLPHEIEFTLEKNKILISNIKPEGVNINKVTAPENNYEILRNSAV